MSRRESLARGRSPAGERQPGRLRRLSQPRPVQLAADRDGVPVSLAGVPVEAVLEDWVVEDRWWTGRPLSRRHFELVLASGRNVVVFRDLVAGGWYLQRS